MNFQIKKATKSAAKLRLAAFGPSGAGKTYTSLRIATGLGGRIGVIDTERGSASKYSDRFDFDVIELEAHKDIDTIVAAIAAFASARHDVLIIDSLSHAWQELLTEIDKLAQAKYKGNTWSAWSQGTPKQRMLVDAILAYPGHVIATMRSKTEWTQETDSRTGKTKPLRVGLAPEQGKGIEYEFDMLMELSVSHIAEIIKDRTGKFQDALVDKPGEDFGRELAAWLSEGAPTLPVVAPVARAEAPVAAPVVEAPQRPAQTASDGEAPVTDAQLKAIARELKKQDMHKDGERHAKALPFFRWLTERDDIKSATDLTAAEATGFLGMVARGAFEDRLAAFEDHLAEPDWSGVPVPPASDAAPFEPNGRSATRQKVAS
jgi:hypothetical protein